MGHSQRRLLRETAGSDLDDLEQTVCLRILSQVRGQTGRRRECLPDPILWRVISERRTGELLEYGRSLRVSVLEGGWSAANARDCRAVRWRFAVVHARP